MFRCCCVVAIDFVQHGGLHQATQPGNNGERTKRAAEKRLTASQSGKKSSKELQQAKLHARPRRWWALFFLDS